MGRSATLDTRSRLVSTAADMLWERSFHASGVDQICARAKALKGSFYHFFPSKTDLAIEAVEQSWKHIRETVFEPALAAEGSGLERLRRVVRAVNDLQRRAHKTGGVYLGCPFGSLGQEMAHQDRRVQEAVHAILEGHVDFFERALRQASADGDIEPGNLRQRARNALALLEGALLLAKVANAPATFSAVLRALPQVVARDWNAPGDDAGGGRVRSRAAGTGTVGR